MPRIDEKVLDGVAFLFRSEEEARKRERRGGSAFIVGRPLKDAEKHLGRRSYVPYLVSNRHVVFEGGACVASVNRIDRGLPDIWDIDQNDWFAHPGGDDVAACCIMGPLDKTIHRISFTPEHQFITPDMIRSHSIGVGDEVLMVGRFINMQGANENLQAARFGSMSTGLCKIPVPGPLGNVRYQESFAVEMRSRTGFSGSPVVAYRTLATTIATSQDAQRDYYGLLGVNYGYIQDEVGENTFLNGVVPAWKITELLNSPPLAEIHRRHEEFLRENAAELRANRIDP